MTPTSPGPRHGPSCALPAELREREEMPGGGLAAGLPRRRHDADERRGNGRKANGRALLRTAPFLVVFPGVAIAGAVLAVTLSGDGLARRLGILGWR